MGGYKILSVVGKQGSVSEGAIWVRVRAGTIPLKCDVARWMSYKYSLGWFAA